MDQRKLVFGRGPRHVQRLVLDEVTRLTPTEICDLEAPLRIIVPSEALRRHLLTVLMRERGRALVGVVVQTLVGAANEILRRADAPLPGEDAAFVLLVRRYAAAEPVLHAGLGELDDGYDGVAATVRDLLDAGFEAAHEDALLEQLEAIAMPVVTGRRLHRAAAIIRVAAAVDTEAGRLGAGRSSTLLRRAAEQVFADEAVIPCRGVLVHGFADATAVATDLIEALLRAYSGVVFLDRPPDPADHHRNDVGVAFLDRFALRFSGFNVDEPPAPVSAWTELEVLASAPQPCDEVRGAARRVRALIDHGVAPEGIAVVARDLSSYSGSLVRYLERYGIPFSGVGARLAGGSARRRARALADLLRHGLAASMDSWVGALSLSATARVELGLGLRHLGLSRLIDLAELPDEALGFTELPLGVAEAIRDPTSKNMLYRALPVERLAAEADRATDFAGILASWPLEAVPAEHLERTCEVLGILGSDDTAEAEDEVLGVFEACALSLPEAMVIHADEWRSMVREALERWGDTVLGGIGAGVQVLSVMEARGLCFEHLHLLGMNRGLFPRVIVEDALMPDAVRARLQPELPDIPIKSRAWSEESYLFAQLAASAVTVTCSRSATRNGKSTAISSFIERLETNAVGEAPPGVVGGTAVLPAFDTAIEAAQEVSRAELVVLTDAAISEGRQRACLAPSPVPPGDLAAARLDILDVVDPKSPAPELSPFWGFVGPGCASRGQSVTLFENIAVCPWRTLVARRLGVAAAPDPAVDFMGFNLGVVGEVVHRSLQLIVEKALGAEVRSLARATTREPVPVPWPDAALLDAVIVASVEHVLRRHHLQRPSAVPLLAEMARPYLEVERRVEWPGGGARPGALGAEVSGVVEIDEPEVSLSFRADRVDEIEDCLVFVDYKGSSPIGASSKKAETRHKHVMKKLASGRLLQAAAYVQSAKIGAAQGRYLFLKPGVRLADEEARIAELSAADPEVERRFREAVGAIDAAWRRGACFPRVEPAADKGENTWCPHCEIREACVRGDSEQRRRLSAWLNAGRDGGGPDGAEAAARALWWLGIDE